MTRLPPVTESQLTDDQRQVWDSITATRKGTAAVGPEGGLIGPFNAMVTAPRIGVHQTRLGAELRFNTSIERRLTEVAICTVGAHWKSEFEFWAHSKMALEHGVPAAAVQALADGGTPAFDLDDEKTVYAITCELLQTGRVDDSLFKQGVDLLDHTGMVELASLIGYYCMISLTLNMFDVALPEGEETLWSRDPAVRQNDEPSTDQP